MEAEQTVNHLIFTCSLFHDFVNENLFAEILICNALYFRM